MGIKYSFVDNLTYGTDDINDITRNLTGAGVAPFLTKNSYTADDLNGLTEAVVSGGAQLGGCRCSISGGIVTVSQGVIFFDNGVCLTVDGSGYNVNAAPGTEGYIFAHYNTSLQTADIVFAEEIPTTGESVVLAYVSAVGVLTDKRTYARSKVATLGRNIALKKQITSLISEPTTLAGGGYIVIKIDDVDLSKYNYAIFSLPPGLGIETACFCVVDLATGRFIDRAFVWYGAEPQSSKAHFVYDFGNVSTNSYNISLYIRIIDGAFCVICDQALPGDYRLHPTIIFV